MRMRWVAAVWLAVLCCGASVVQAALRVCTTTYNGRPTMAEAVSDRCVSYLGASWASHYSCHAQDVTTTTFAVHWECNDEPYCGSGSAYAGQNLPITVTCTGTCDAGTTADKLTVAGNSSAVSGTSVCYSGCTMSTAASLQVHGSGSVSSSYDTVTATGSTCGTPTSGLTTGECNSTGGVTACTVSGAEAHNCGTFNGDEVCVSSLTSGCQSYASGGIACIVPAGGPAAPPLPNNGTPGTPATPSGSVHSGSTVLNYYSSSVVSSSTVSVSNPGGTSAGGSTVSTVGDGKGNKGTECGKGMVRSGADCVGSSVTGGEDCVAPPVCTGDAVECAAVFQAWRARCPVTLTEGDLEGAVGSVEMPSSTVNVSGSLSESGPVALSVAGCPAAPTITVMGAVIQLTWISYLCAFAGQVSAVVMVGAYLTAVKILSGWGSA